MSRNTEVGGGKSPFRKCESCGAQMTHLSDLPSRLNWPAKSVFRCYDCDIVASNEVPAALFDRE
jgi:hypothetical protein